MRGINPSRIGFDIDGVVADTMEAFIRIAQSEYGVTVLPEEITEFQVEDCLDLDPAASSAIFHRLLEDPVGCNLRLMPGAKPVLTALARFGPLTFITARPLAEPVTRWLTLELGEALAGRVRLVACGDHDGKARHIRELDLSHFIDDRAETCLQLAREEGIFPIVYRQPWNTGKHELPEVRNWEAIHALCCSNETSAIRA